MCVCAPKTCIFDVWENWKIITHSHKQSAFTKRLSVRIVKYEKYESKNVTILSGAINIAFTLHPSDSKLNNKCITSYIGFICSCTLAANNYWTYIVRWPETDSKWVIISVTAGMCNKATLGPYIYKYKLYTHIRKDKRKQKTHYNWHKSLYWNYFKCDVVCTVCLHCPLAAKK